MFRINDRIIHKFSGDKGMIRSLADNRASILFDSNNDEESIYLDEIEKDNDKLSDIRERVINSSSMIIAKFSNGEFKFSSGINISDNHILTSLDATILGEKIEHSQVWINSSSGFQKAKIVCASRKNNLSVLEVEERNLFIANLGNSSLAGNGNQIVYAGLDSQFRNRTCLGHVFSKNRIIFADKNKPKVHIINGPVTSSASGGAVVDPRNGDTIGMIVPVVSATKGNGYNVIVPSEYIMQWLDENQIEYQHGIEIIPSRYIISEFRETDFSILDREDNILYKSSTKNNGFKHRKLWESERQAITRCLYDDNFSEVTAWYKFQSKSISSKKYRIDKSSIHGKGVIADRDLFPGEYIGNVIVTGDMLKSASHNGSDIRTELGTYINYDKSPNAKINAKGKLYAKLPISKGTELTLDYLAPEVVKITGVEELRFQSNG